MSTKITVAKVRRFTIFACLCTSFMNAAVVTAAEAEKLIQEGVELRRAGRDADALEKFEAAYAAEKTPRAAAQLGLCLQAVSRWSEAEPFLAEALSAAKDPWIKKSRSTLKDSLEVIKSHVGRIEVIGDPDGASVSVGGKLVGTLPLPRAVTTNEGAVDVEVAAEGYKRLSRTMMVTGASYQRVVFHLEKLVLTTVPVARSQDPTADAVTASSNVDVSSSATSEPPKSIMKSPWLWAGLGVVIAGTVAAILLTSGGTSYPSSDQVRDVP